MTRISDAELLKVCDEHEAGTNSTEAEMLDSMLKQQRQGRSLSPKQRAWAERLLIDLDRRGARGGDDDDAAAW